MINDEKQGGKEGWMDDDDRRETRAPLAGWAVVQSRVDPWCEYE